MSAIDDKLNLLLADYQVLNGKIRGYHWNVTGRYFYQLHDQFELLYNSLTVKVDDIAERVRALGKRPLVTMKSVLEKARLSEDDSQDAEAMVANVAADFETINGHLRETIAAAEGAGDDTSADMLRAMVEEQEKTIWMLRSFLA